MSKLASRAESNGRPGRALAKSLSRQARRKYVKGMLRKDAYLYVMLIPGIVFYIIFHYIPMYGLLIAFKNFELRKGILGSPWVGFKYFRQFFDSPDAWDVIRNTLTINLLELVLVFPAPIVLAVLLNELRLQAFKRFIQSVSYMPHFLSTVVVVGMVVNFLSPHDGVVNVILQKVFGIEPTYFMGEAAWFKPVYIASDIWQTTGWGSIIYIVAITGIDPTLYEAAKIDGASHETADVISSYVYRKGLLDANFGFAAAVGLFQSVIGFIMVVLTNQAARRFSSTSLW
ncbi:MAG: sugar transporter permease [Paenibacillaceae bacterium]|nr:sugar transporter permease [Paenibacillaceae bacterium]